QYFARFGIPVSAGGAADTVDEAVAEADKAGYPVVVKAQVQVGGRGKAGGVKLAENVDEVRTHAGNILGMDIRGHTVRRVWIEHARLDPRATEGAVDILLKLYRCFVEGDADLVEINPLILTPDGRVHALDAKVTLDDNAAFRHPEWDEFRGLEHLDARSQ